MKDAFQKVRVALAQRFLSILVQRAMRPRMPTGMIYIPSGPLVGGELSFWMHVPFAQDQRQLILAKSDRPVPAERSECQVPTPHTQDTPICTGIEMTSALYGASTRDCRPLSLAVAESGHSGSPCNQSFTT